MNKYALTNDGVMLNALRFDEDIGGSGDCVSIVSGDMMLKLTNSEPEAIPSKM